MLNLTIYLLYKWVLYFHLFSIVTLCPFISTWKTPVSISWKAGLVVMNSLSFCLFLGMSLYLHFWRTVLQSVVLLVGIYFFLLALWIYHSTPSWSTKFLLRNPLIALWGFPYMWWAIFPLLFSKFSLALIFNIFNSCRFPFVFFILSFFIFFWFLWLISNDLSSICWFFLLHDWVCCWSLCSIFHFCRCTLQLQDLFLLFYVFYFFIKILILFVHYFTDLYSCLSVLSSISLCFCKMIILNYLSGNS